MHTKLSAVISESGIWSGLRADTHSFLLSPDTFPLTEAKRTELERLGYAIHYCLAGLSHIATIAFDQSLHYRGSWSLVRKLFSAGIPKYYRKCQALNVQDIPRLLKIDLMVNEVGEFKIAEIDGHNKHGVGYSTLARRFREALYPKANALPGTVKLLASETNKLGYDNLTLVYGDHERFYLPEFEIVRQEFARYNINCKVVSELQLEESACVEGLFVDLPFFNKRPKLSHAFVDGYKNGRIKFIIPPKPFFGSKAVLALLRNDDKKPELESLLRAFISGVSLDLVRRYIPETYAIGRGSLRMHSAQTLAVNKRYVLKKTVASGMKGMAFSSDDRFDIMLRTACGADFNWVFQEEVKNASHTFSWFEKQNGNAVPQLKTSEDWFVRVTVQYVHRQLADVIITARRDKAVHGAKDCLQIGAVLV